MPELPEVETMVRGIRDAVEGATLVNFRRHRCRCKPISIKPSLSKIRNRISGASVTQVTRRAKRVVIILSTGDRFVIEPRMTGLVLLDDAPNSTHLRCRWDFERDGKSFALDFWDRRGLGTVAFYSEAEAASRLGSEYLGPDALEMTPQLWRSIFENSTRPIKVGMLDQKKVAGIGNLYASEILHRAKISPLRPAGSLEDQEWKRLNQATKRILNRAIKYEGSTLSDGTYRNALNRDGRYQNEHVVYDQAGKTCSSCGQTEIIRIVQAQRSTFYCPNCQS